MSSYSTPKALEVSSSEARSGRRFHVPSVISLSTTIEAMISIFFSQAGHQHYSAGRRQTRRKGKEREKKSERNIEQVESGSSFRGRNVFLIAGHDARASQSSADAGHILKVLTRDD